MPIRRTSDREREAAVERLKRQLVDGSLSTETFGLRVERALSSTAKRDISNLLDDLPGLRSGLIRLRERLSQLAGRDDPTAELALPRVSGCERLTIGREENCDFLVDDPTVSRRHATLERRSRSWWLVDTGSTNGTRVNGWRVRDSELRPGDQVELGHARFRVIA